MAKPANQKTHIRSEQDQQDTRGRPEVIVEFLFERGLLSICVRNIGTRPAVRVAVKFNQKLTGLGGAKEISTMPLFKNIEFLGPERQITTFVDSSSSYFSRKQPTRIAAKLTYSDFEDRKYETTINHDLEIYRDLVYTSASTDL